MAINHAGSTEAPERCGHWFLRQCAGTWLFSAVLSTFSSLTRAVSERMEGGKDYFLSQLSSLNVVTADDGVCCQ